MSVPLAGRAVPPPLPTVLSGSDAPLWWGIWVVVAIESTVFATFLSGYLYIRFSSPTWPQDGIDLPGLLMPAINTAVLLASSVAVFLAVRAVKRGDPRRLKIWLGAGILLEVAFFGGKVIETRMLPFRWDTNAYGSAFWTISTLHSIHIVVAIIFAGAVEVLALRGYYSRENYLGVQVASIYWQFVAIVWLPVAFVLYLVPRWW